MPLEIESNARMSHGGLTKGIIMGNRSNFSQNENILYYLHCEFDRLKRISTFRNKKNSLESTYFGIIPFFCDLILILIERAHFHLGFEEN